MQTHLTFNSLHNMTMHLTARLSNKLLLSLFLCTLLCACQGNSEVTSSTPTQKITGDAPSAPDANPSDTAQNDVGAKLQQYVTCYNKIDESAHRTITRYASWVKDMNAGPTGKEMNIYGLYSLDGKDIAQCKTVFEKAASLAPALAKLDSAGLAYADAITALNKAVDDVYTYYDREDYKDDHFAKGKQLHTPLAASMKTFEAASDEFAKELQIENDKLLEADLARIEKTQGRKLPYLHGSMMYQAKQLVRIIEANDFPADLAAAKLADYEKIADEAMAFAKQNPGGSSSGWSSVERETEDFRKAAKERVRRIRDKVPYSEGEKMQLTPGSGWMVEGSQEKVVTAYNKLIEASNDLR